VKKTLLSITRKQLLLATLSGILLGLAWHKPFTFLIFIGFVPLFLLFENVVDDTNESKIDESTTDFSLFGLFSFAKTEGKQIKYLAYFCFVIWNLVAYWWLYYASFAAFLFAVFANSFLMLLPTLLYRFITRKTDNKFGLFAFIVCWISFEYLHTQNWAFTWTWLNLGNAFGNMPTWVQWYEYTGVFGGTAWVLGVNYLVAKFLMNLISAQTVVTSNESTTKFSFNRVGEGRSKILVILAALLIPISISQIIFYTYNEKGKATEIVVIQPNIDTYTEKFEYNAHTISQNTTTYIPFDKQFERFLNLMRSSVTDKTALVLMPETAWSQDIDESAINADLYISKIRAFRDSFPNLSILTGADSYQFYYNTPEAPTATARYYSPNLFYDVYNSALFIDSKNQTKFYHKSMLVVGVESNPLRGVLGFLQKIIMTNLSGLIGDLGVQKERTVFAANNNLKAAPIVCYESIYGEYVTDYVKNGANMLCVITNDGWWNDSPAPRQHLSFASLRAIETRRSLARSANTGISAFINQKGEITQQSKYNEKIALRNSLKMNEEITFYVRFGDILARFAIFVVLYLLITTIQAIRTKANVLKTNN
jgi:apolipoprotein N-acyltransferase